MNHTELGEMENRFAQLIWKHQPIPSGKLTRLCEQEFEWKKSTTYTMLKRLCQRGIFENENGMVKALISQEEIDQLRQLIDQYKGE